MSRVAILDRDGVINADSDDYILSPDAFRPLPGSLAAIARLTRAGWRVAVATNQSAVGRGWLDRETLDAIHARMHELVEAAGGRIDAIACCPHAPDAGCGCRKPEPGLLLELLETLDAQAAQTPVPFIGDSLRDLQAARAAGCRPVLVRTGNGAVTAERLPGDCLGKILVVDDLDAAVTHLLEGPSP